MRASCFVLLVVVTMGLMISHASAGTMFSDNFTGGASANWANPGVADYTNDNAAFNGAGDPDRVYLHTFDTDYAVRDFVATVDLTNNSMVFFGMGAAVPYSGEYYEPQTDPFVYVRFNFAGFFDTYMHLVWSDDWPGGQVVGTPSIPTGTTIRVKLDWEAATTTATFSVDEDMDDVYDNTFSTVVEEFGEAGATARLFVGGAGGAVADNFSVVPEPSTFVLLVAGLLGLFVISRRKK